MKRFVIWSLVSYCLLLTVLMLKTMDVRDAITKNYKLALSRQSYFVGCFDARTNLLGPIKDLSTLIEITQTCASASVSFNPSKQTGVFSEGI